ncbi:type III PLP-dependent enzyme [Leisingera sp. ANG-M1]|uniref:type III PLP-dependent enzyme n=1 Tax=Leisingera sp. ANG-M1 TaxID=1577895 RepID=UPI00068C6174|nr:type III PLP-dependent enzyme [Leisingera sp. ANG-M1]
MRMTWWESRQNFLQPTLVLDRSVVTTKFSDLSAGLGDVDIFYAVKANPHPDILKCLLDRGASFDAASGEEIRLCLKLGADPSAVSFGNTIKSPHDIKFAFDSNVRTFAADCRAELEKISSSAPGSDVFIRVQVEAAGADWPLDKKFGCDPKQATALLSAARDLGLIPRGLSFHIGSQARCPSIWDSPIAQVSAVWKDALRSGISLSLLNIGGGFPAVYDQPQMPLRDYSATVRRALEGHFPGVRNLMAEPGRSLVAEAGAIAANVLLVDRKRPKDTMRWVYLDIGVFSGLAETLFESIRYPLATDFDDQEMGPCILAGPSCDSTDIMYQEQPVQLPLGLTSGSRILIRNAGAYTTAYASSGFNGFPPPRVLILPEQAPISASQDWDNCIDRMLN